MNFSLGENFDKKIQTEPVSICARQHWSLTLRIVELSSYTAFYIVGSIGCLLALIHLWKKRNFKNPKHAIMLKCLMGCDLIGICGMLIQLILEICMKTHFQQSYKKYKIVFCQTRVLWRFFGLNSGCVAFTMALERWFALTKPFLYYKYITKGLIKRTIFVLWIFSGIVIFCPLFGFGTYYIGDEKTGTVNCTRYREATEFKDVLYSYILFTVGVSLCICILICNFSVSKILLRSYHQMQLRLSSFEIAHNARQMGSLKHQNSDFNSSTPTRGSFVTREEIRFAKLMILLSITFVICWGSTMVTIPLSHIGVRYTCFDIITNILMLLHFTLDPYIYVLFKTNYWLNFKNFLSSLTTPARNRNASRNMSMISSEFSGIARIEMKPL